MKNHRLYLGDAVRFIIKELRHVWVSVSRVAVFLVLGVYTAYNTKPTIETDYFIADVIEIAGQGGDQYFPYILQVKTPENEEFEVQSNNLGNMFIGKQICVIKHDRQTRIDPIVYRHDSSCGYKN